MMQSGEVLESDYVRCSSGSHKVLARAKHKVLAAHWEPWPQSVPVD